MYISYAHIPFLTCVDIIDCRLFENDKINEDLPFKNPNHESKITAWKYSSDVLELCMPIVGGERTRSFPILI
jgi:hypothetical protein